VDLPIIIHLILVQEATLNLNPNQHQSLLLKANLLIQRRLVLLLVVVVVGQTRLPRLPLVQLLLVVVVVIAQEDFVTSAIMPSWFALMVNRLFLIQDMTMPIAKEIQQALVMMLPLPNYPQQIRGGKF
jgi:hypothetical protein